MNKVFLHMGPPKTGTTSLQYWLKQQTFHDYSYEGAIQPRGTDSTAISDSLLNSFNYGYDSLLREKIENKLYSKSLIISEEIFLVTPDKIKWENSMKDLFDTLFNLDPTIIICLREPKEAIRSYYQEVYHILPRKLRKDVNEFASSDWCFIYNYKALSNSLLKIGFTNIKYISFDKLVSGDYRFNDIFGGSDERKIILNRENISKKTDSKSISNNKLSLKKNISSFLPETLVNLLRNINITTWLPDISYHKQFRQHELDVSLNEVFHDNYLQYLKKLV